MGKYGLGWYATEMAEKIENENVFEPKKSKIEASNDGRDRLVRFISRV